MSDKFDFYDVLSIIVPGSMLMCAGILFFPDAAKSLKIENLPEAFSVLVLTAAAVFLGHIIQSLVSIVEPLLDWSWGGRLSEQALKYGLGDRYFPTDSAKRISGKLTTAVGTNASDRSKFLFALQLAETSQNSRVGRFNALYAYHRALLMMMVVALALFLISMFWGPVSKWPICNKLASIGGGLALAALLWHRTKQRGMYYVREVLYTAERLLNQQPQTK